MLIQVSKTLVGNMFFFGKFNRIMATQTLWAPKLCKVEDFKVHRAGKVIASGCIYPADTNKFYFMNLKPLFEERRDHLFGSEFEAGDTLEIILNTCDGKYPSEQFATKYWLAMLVFPNYPD